MANGSVEIRQINEIHAYLYALQNLKDCLIAVAAKDTLGFCLTEDINAEMQKLGFTVTLTKMHWRGFAGAVLDGKAVFERLGEKDQAVCEEKGIADTALKIVSKPYNNGNLAEICINGINYAVNRRGLNIVVYDLKKKCVMDAVAFDTHAKELKITREDLTKILYRNKVSLDAILPSKIEVRIFWEGEVHLWNVIKSVVYAFHADCRFHTAVVCWIPPNYGTAQDKIERLKELNIEGVLYDPQDIESADIVITMPRNRIMKIITCKKMVAAVPMSLVEDFTKELLDTPENVHLDYLILDKLLYDQAEKNNLLCPQIKLIGSPKFDEIYNKLKETEFPDKWGKIKGKTVFLWTTDHVWRSANVTFDLYARKIFEYFERNNDVALIFRPHPVYIAEMLNERFWTKEDVGRLRTYFENTANMIWDEMPDYSMAYKTADAVITDVNCGIAVSALALLKPMCILRRFDGQSCEPLFPEITDCLYNAGSVKECMDFFDRVREDKTYTCEQVKEVFEKSIHYFDGQNGKRIKDFVVEEYFKRYGRQDGNS